MVRRSTSAPHRSRVSRSRAKACGQPVRLWEGAQAAVFVWDNSPILILPLKGPVFAAKKSPEGQSDVRIVMSDRCDRSPYAGFALVLATLFGCLFWAGIGYALLPKGWISWPAGAAQRKMRCEDLHPLGTWPRNDRTVAQPSF